MVEFRGFPALLTAALQGQIAVTGTSGLQLHSCWIHGPFREGLPSRAHRGNLVGGCGGNRVVFLLRIRTVIGHVSQHYRR